MRKFTTIFMAVVLCIAALTVFAFAANCDHDWSASVLVKVDGCNKYYERTCACGEKDGEGIFEHTEETIPAVDVTCDQPGLTEGKKCTTCGEILVAQEEIAPIAHTIEHVEEKTVVCGDAENGNIEYWYCTVCGYAWLDEACTLNTNLQAVKLPIDHNIEYVAAKAATCFELGNIEYWYCKDCGYAWLDEFCTKNTNLQAVKLPLAHVVEHVEAKAATATENGNIEYWYCKDCGYAWLDAACTKNTNLKAVILPATAEPTTDPVNPGTGDNAIIFAVALVAVAVAGVAVVSFKKREN